SGGSTSRTTRSGRARRNAHAPQAMKWGWAAAPVGALAAAHMVPSVVSLGQWLPVRALPGGWCRWRGPDAPAVALTFDDGPDPTTTPAVLDRLDELGLHATFFCLGAHAAAHPDLVAEALRRGHAVGTHGYEHAHHFARPPRWVRADLDRAMTAMAAAGARPHRAAPRRRRRLAPRLVAQRARRARADRGCTPPAGAAFGHPRGARRGGRVRALFLSGKFGAGHDTLAEACDAALGPHGVESRIVDCMPMLGSGGAAAGNWVFKRLLSIDAVYDGFHFSQLRANGAVGRFMDRAAVRVMFPNLVAEVDAYAPDLIVSVFSTGAAAAARLKLERPSLRTVVFMTDSFAYGMWAHEGTDLFLVTSELAAASVLRYCPGADVRVVDAPVRPGFYAAPSQHEARVALGVPDGPPCVLLMSGAWGIGPLDAVARALAAEGW